MKRPEEPVNIPAISYLSWTMVAIMLPLIDPTHLFTILVTGSWVIATIVLFAYLYLVSVD